MAGLSGTFPVYATADDLKVYVGGEQQPADIANADDLLAEASLHVRRAIRAAVYSTSADGMPTRESTRDALHDATVLQAAALHAIGWTKGTSLATDKPTVASKSLGGASVTYESGGGAAGAARRALVDGDLAASAIQVLEDGGLLSTQVQSARAYPTRPLARVRGWL
ncbi:head-to-tail adaptor [Microbacterium phage Phonegingi]|nr:head-to-tail adaptor [Microbacterium phage Phonegingi]